MSIEPLDEEGPDPAPLVVDPKSRRLQALAGPGNAYIFIAIDAVDGATIDYAGLTPGSVPIGLREIAGLIDRDLQ